MRDVVRADEHRSLRRVLRYGAAGLAVGGVVGYLGALVMPRRYPLREGAYQAPVPERFVPQQRQRTDVRDAAVQPDLTGTGAGGTGR